MEWGKEWQKSGTGSDNYRTNIIEALIGEMKAKGYGGCLQRAWAMMMNLGCRFENATKQELLEKALTYEPLDLLTKESVLIMKLVSQVVGWEDEALMAAFLPLIPTVRQLGLAPDYTIRQVCGCGDSQAVAAGTARLCDRETPPE